MTIDGKIKDESVFCFKVKKAFQNISVILNFHQKFKDI